MTPTIGDDGDDDAYIAIECLCSMLSIVSVLSMLRILSVIAQ